MNKSLFSLLLVLAFFLATSMARPPHRKAWAQYGPFPIQNFSAPEVIKAGSFAVSQYDKTSTDHLEFIRVVNGTKLQLYFAPSSEIIWFLNVEAKNCSQHGNTDIYATQVTEMHERCPPFFSLQPPADYCNRDYLSSSGLVKLPAV